MDQVVGQNPSLTFQVGLSRHGNIAMISGPGSAVNAIGHGLSFGITGTRFGHGIPFDRPTESRDEYSTKRSTLNGAERNDARSVR